jgi:hypothetical protein
VTRGARGEVRLIGDWQCLTPQEARAEMPLDTPQENATTTRKLKADSNTTCQPSSSTIINPQFSIFNLQSSI